MEENKPVELAPDVLNELMVPEYIDQEWLKEQPKKVYRLDRSGHRYYYTYNDKGEPTFFVSVTTFIKQTMPTSPHLIKWMADMGSEESKRYAEERAAYGTFLHMQCAKLMEEAKYDLDLLTYELEGYMEEHRLPHTFRAYSEDLKKDVLAFSAFMIEYNVIPVAIELVLTHEEYGVAGAIDLVCEMDVEVDALSDEVFKSGPRKGMKKPIKVKERKLCIVDLKSGRKGFFEGMEIQLHCYWDMWKRNFPDLQVERVYNWSPKEWRTAPSYNLKDQTDSRSAKKLPLLIDLAKIEDERKNNSLTICHGVIEIQKGLYPNVETIELSELVKRKRGTDTKN